MAGKAKFDQEAAFKSIIGADRRPVEKEEGKNLTESVNDALRVGVKKYL